MAKTTTWTEQGAAGPDIARTPISNRPAQTVNPDAGGCPPGGFVRTRASSWTDKAKLGVKDAPVGKGTGVVDFKRMRGL